MALRGADACNGVKGRLSRDPKKARSGRFAHVQRVSVLWTPVRRAGEKASVVLDGRETLLIRPAIQSKIQSL